MVDLRCQGCGRIVHTKKKNWEEDYCKICKDSFSILNSEDDTYVDDEEDKEVDDDEEAGVSICDECGEEKENENILSFKNIDFLICKSCIDEIYPRKQDIKIIEKYIELPKEDMKTIGLNEPIL